MNKETGFRPWQSILIKACGQETRDNLIPLIDKDTVGEILGKFIYLNEVNGSVSRDQISLEKYSAGYRVIIYNATAEQISAANDMGSNKDIMRAEILDFQKVNIEDYIGKKPDFRKKAEKTDQSPSDGKTRLFDVTKARKGKPSAPPLDKNRSW